jgi:hypothetical protein
MGEKDASTTLFSFTSDKGDGRIVMPRQESIP